MSTIGSSAGSSSTSRARSASAPVLVGDRGRVRHRAVTRTRPLPIAPSLGAPTRLSVRRAEPLPGSCAGRPSAPALDVAAHDRPRKKSFRCARSRPKPADITPRVARDRRRGRHPRPPRHRGRDAAARQAQADLGAARRHRRPRDRRQRVQARHQRRASSPTSCTTATPATRAASRTEIARAPARPRPREGRAPRGEAHAAEGPARPPAC